MEYIIELVRKTIEKYNTRNPFEICREAGIGVKFKDIGNLKGFYSVINKRTYIVINDSISEKEAELVCAHELGHHLLHDYLADNPVIREIFILRSSDASGAGSQRICGRAFDSGRRDARACKL